MDVDVLLNQPPVDRGERPPLAPEAFDGVDDGVVAVRGRGGQGLGFGKKIVHLDPLDCLTVASAKKSSMTLSTCGEKRRRSALASAAMRAAKARGKDMVLRTVGSTDMGLFCVGKRRFIHLLSDSYLLPDCRTVNPKK